MRDRRVYKPAMLDPDVPTVLKDAQPRIRKPLPD
jgi:hypothetical protein